MSTTTTSVSKPPVSHPTQMTPDEQAALKEQNDARARHGCPPLHWDAQLSKNAAVWAEHLAKDVGHMQHSTAEERPNQGENLFWSWTSDHKEGTYAQAAKGWLDEEKFYHGEAIGQGDFEKWGHYTQCLWKSTTHVGMARAVDAKGGTFVVGRYSPPGNWARQKPY